MTTTTAPVAATVARVLRRLYLIRFVFALIWAVVLFSTASSIGPVSATLLVIYPLFDVGAAIVDARSSRASRSALGLYVNIAISVIAAVGLVFVVTSGIPAVLRVWGVWAVSAGLVQLVVALRRRTLGGQWAMIASGTISTVAGISFFLQASDPHASLSNMAGYALLGGVFFLLSALRLGRNASRDLGRSSDRPAPPAHPQWIPRALVGELAIRSLSREGTGKEPTVITDPTIMQINEAVQLSHQGEREAARLHFAEIWDEIGGEQGDPLHRCTLAHAMADVQDDVREELVWDQRALAAADLLTDERVAQAGVPLPVAGLYPSLHLNLSECYRKLGDLDRAREHLQHAQTTIGALGDDGYGQMIRDGLERVAERLR